MNIFGALVVAGIVVGGMPLIRRYTNRDGDRSKDVYVISAGIAMFLVGLIGQLIGL